MELRTIIYTTSKSQWIERDFESIYETLRKVRGMTFKPFTVRTIELPDNVPTYKSGGVYISWDWIREHCPADGHNAVCLHITDRQRDELGLKHPDPEKTLGGVYDRRDGDNSLDFVVIADKSDRSYGGMTGFERIFIHELSHGMTHWLGKIDYTHTWDYVVKNVKAAYFTYDFAVYNSLVKKIADLRQQLVDIAKQLQAEKLHAPLDPQFMDKVSQTFGVPDPVNYPTTGHHVGTDWAVPTGENCYALAAGKVVRAYENHPTLGNACEFEFTYRGRLYTARYMHLSRPVEVRSYKRGEIIGYTGNTGLSTNPHLHLDIMIGVFSLAGLTPYNFREKFIDPLTLLS